LLDSQAFFLVGGFSSLESLGGEFEETDLTRQIAGYNESSYIPHVIACIRAGDTRGTTDYASMFWRTAFPVKKL
jgi:hypothetical protein